MRSRGHGSHLGCGFRGLRQCGFRQSADAVEDLLGIEAARAGEPLPVPPGDFECELLGDVFPNLTAHDIVHRRQRRAIAADHDRMVLGVGVGVEGHDIDEDHVEQTHPVGRG
jgi:hypothetical protein